MVGGEAKKKTNGPCRPAIDRAVVDSNASGPLDVLLFFLTVRCGLKFCLGFFAFPSRTIYVWCMYLSNR